MTPAAMKESEMPVYSVNVGMRWTARIIPAFLAMVVGYELYLVGKHVLMEQFYHEYNRFSLGVGLLVPYVVIAALMVASYARTIYTIHTNPSVTPLGPDKIRYFYGENKRGSSRRRQKQRPLRLAKAPLANGAADLESGLANAVPYDTNAAAQRGPEPRLDPDSPGLELFYTRDMFECAADGRPIWCNECGTWKPDRTHHCSEINRCVRKMDHFCPWVGGIVSETTFKFFLQFNFYATLLCAFTIGICGYALWRRTILDAGADARIIVGLVLASFFGLFAWAMSLTCACLAVMNLTTVESHQRKDRIRMMAVRIRRGSPPVEGRYGVVTYPLPKDEMAPDCMPVDATTNGLLQRGRQQAESEAPALVDGAQERPRDEDNPFKTARAARAARRAARDQLAYRTFAIIPVERGMNVWDLGWWENWVSVMGRNPLDWLFPIHNSPCSHHEMHRALYPVGPAFKRLCAQYQLPPCTEMEKVS